MAQKTQKKSNTQAKKTSKTTTAKATVAKETNSKTAKQTSTKKNVMNVTSDMNIGEIVGQYPETIPVLTEHGIHCIGCGAANFESLDEGLKAHGMDDKEIASVVKKLNNAVDEIERNPQSITVTKKAAAEINKLMKAEKEKKAGLRIEIVPGGCSGFQYNMDFSNKEKGDKEIDSNGVKVLVDAESFKMLKGAIVDYIKNEQGEGFNIMNPNIGSTCH